MEIDREAPAVASSEIEVATGPDVVWDVMADFERWPDWNPEVKSVSVSGPPAEGTTFKWKSSGATLSSTVERAARPELLAWTGRASGMRAIHVWHFEARGDKSYVRTEESLDGWLVRLFRRRVQKVLQTGLDDSVRQLKAEAERRARE